MARIGHFSDNPVNCGEFLASRLEIPRDPSIQTLPTLGPNVYNYYLHWAMWILRGCELVEMSRCCALPGLGLRAVPIVQILSQRGYLRLTHGLDLKP